MKNKKYFLIAAILIFVGILFLSTNDQESMDINSEGISTILTNTLETQINELPKLELSREEIQGLVYIREEEKLARDVYLNLYEKWGLNIFNNIARAEQTHTDAVKLLLDKYEINDPSLEAQGEFSNEEIQTLYNDLTTQGSLSLLDALIIGATIEDLDIIDVTGYRDSTEKEDLILVYNNLIKGSRNHLRSFTKQINFNGGEYVPQFLSQEEYDEIVSSGIERGRR